MGMIHVYCGDGKGKTTCALGLAVRAAGAGMNVVVVQFLKGSYTSELESLSQIHRIKVLRNSRDYGFVNNMTPEQLSKVIDEHNKNLDSALNLVKRGECQILVLDELTYVYDMNLVDKNKIKNLIENNENDVEIVVTGRNPNELFLNNADYVTEMKEIKHPYDKGFPARKGIEY
ncbi:MAG: cob(I)yrinic acid a,c-diamide adenosyltransferase [Oscillospiraceae bacterium]